MLNALLITAVIELLAVGGVFAWWIIKAHAKPQLTDQEIETMREELLRQRVPGVYKLSSTETLVIQKPSSSSFVVEQPSATTVQQDATLLTEVS